MKEAAVKFGKSLNRWCKSYAVARACGELAKEGHHKEAKQLMIMYTNGEIWQKWLDSYVKMTYISYAESSRNNFYAVYHI